jgi:hypothetical protein
MKADGSTLIPNVRLIHPVSHPSRVNDGKGIRLAGSNSTRYESRQRLPLGLEGTLPAMVQHTTAAQLS